MDPLLLATLSSSLVSSLGVFASRRRKEDGTGGELTLDSRLEEALALEGMSPEDLEALLEKAGARESRLPRVAANLTVEETSAVAPIALALDPAAGFSEARSRISLIFRLRLGILVLLLAVGMVSLVGLVVSAAMGNTTLAIGLGIAGVADGVAALVYSPLDKIREALTDTQRIDLIHMSAMDRLQLCHSHEELADRLTCVEQVWEGVLAKIEAMSA